MENTNTIEKVVTQVIQALGELGFFEGKSVKAGWHLVWNGNELSKRGLRAAATAHGADPVMVLPEDFSFERDIEALIHESIHLAQIAKGDFVPGYGDETATWKGKKYNVLPSDHERYFEDQPWEEEVHRISVDVVKKMNELSNRA